MIHQPLSRDLAAITLRVLSIGLMIAACLWVLQPFIGATVWATMIVVATWPLMLAAQARLGGRRWAATTVMTLAMILLLFVPLVLAVAAGMGGRHPVRRAKDRELVAGAGGKKRRGAGKPGGSVRAQDGPVGGRPG